MPFNLSANVLLQRALVGIHENDTQEDLEYCCKRLLACKLWENDSGAAWRHGVKQRELEVLCVSQFTVSARCLPFKPCLVLLSTNALWHLNTIYRHISLSKCSCTGN